MPNLRVTGPDAPLDYVLRRSRRRTIGLRVDQHGLQVIAPSWATREQIDALIREESSWIRQKLAAHEERLLRQSATDACWHHGGIFPYLGRSAILRLDPGLKAALFVPGSEDASPCSLALPLSRHAKGEIVREEVQRWMVHRAHGHFEERLHHFLARSGMEMRSWRLSDARTRWGSCNNRGDIRLNWRLMHLDPLLIDYVVAHEVAHLKHLNHGPHFWNEVERLYPGHHSARLDLRRLDPALLPDFGARGLARFGL